MKEGFGRLHEADNYIYEGMWKSDMPHGHGKEYNPDGSTYEGEFLNGGHIESEYASEFEPVEDDDDIMGSQDGGDIA